VAQVLCGALADLVQHLLQGAETPVPSAASMRARLASWEESCMVTASPLFAAIPQGSR
jgi:hypothetical protein